jgi:hypothetical protein
MGREMCAAFVAYFSHKPEKQGVLSFGYFHVAFRYAGTGGKNELDEKEQNHCPGKYKCGGGNNSQPMKIHYYQAHTQQRKQCSYSNTGAQ